MCAGATVLVEDVATWELSSVLLVDVAGRVVVQCRGPMPWSPCSGDDGVKLGDDTL